MFRVANIPAGMGGVKRRAVLQEVRRQVWSCCSQPAFRARVLHAGYECGRRIAGVARLVAGRWSVSICNILQHLLVGPTGRAPAQRGCHTNVGGRWRRRNGRVSDTALSHILRVHRAQHALHLALRHTICENWMAVHRVNRVF